MPSLKVECLAGWEGWFTPAEFHRKASGGKPPVPTCESGATSGVRPSRFRLLVLVALLLFANAVFAQRPLSTDGPSSRTLTITSEPNAIVWIDEIRRGVTDDSGKLTVKNVSPARHSMRVRANGFKESTVPILPGKRSANVKLVRTTDAAELAFQEAETLREKAKDDEAQQRAVEAYRRALKLRPSFPAARVGLARVLLELNQYREALAEIDAARRARPIYPEASAVEGRINREAAFDEEAIKSFRRSIREAHGFQPEAHVGLARLLEEKGQFHEAIAEYRKALDQLMDSEPVIYQLLGAAYERQQKYKDAIAAYEKYLALAPNGSLAPALRSMIEQLKRDDAGVEIIP
ncbi:MAG: tetratricopeptide repeat protein [Pyrinomonadaceae bacterium]|nr:tetratricopeptide repeat protein [Pyrinomonadaceae bacterium]